MKLRRGDKLRGPAWWISETLRITRVGTMTEAFMILGGDARSNKGGRRRLCEFLRTGNNPGQELHAKVVSSKERLVLQLSMNPKPILAPVPMVEPGRLIMKALSLILGKSQ